MYERIYSLQGEYIIPTSKSSILCAPFLLLPPYATSHMQEELFNGWAKLNILYSIGKDLSITKLLEE